MLTRGYNLISTSYMNPLPNKLPIAKLLEVAKHFTVIMNQES